MNAGGFFLPALVLVFLMVAGADPATASSSKAFRLHLSGEPGNLDPHLQRSSASSYVLQNLHRNLFSFDDDKDLVPELAESCTRGKGGKSLTCKLKSGLKWSDGSTLTAQDFIDGYVRVLDPKTGSLRPDLLFSVKDAKQIFEGKAPVKSLGVSAPDSKTLVFEFIDQAPDFEYNLAAFQIAPAKPATTDPAKMVVSGPYKVKSWTRGSGLVLTANSFYSGGNPSRPDVEFSFIEEDNTALKLYEKGLLDFLRRLPTQYLEQYRKSPEFHWLAVTRLDYYGFGPRLMKEPGARKALALSLDYPQLQKLFQSEGRPGCAGIPESWLPTGKVPCYEFNAAEAKKSLNKAKLPPLLMLISSLGGEDVKRGSEWMQDQWMRNLGLQTSLRMLENKLFLTKVRQTPRPDLFRKGLAADRPTCLAVLEVFSAGHPENLLDLNDPVFEKALRELRGETKSEKKKALCESGLRFLMDRHLFIPLGRMNFAILAKPAFTGWRMNQMNQLDLANLKSAK